MPPKKRPKKRVAAVVKPAATALAKKAPEPAPKPKPKPLPLPRKDRIQQIVDERIDLTDPAEEEQDMTPLQAFQEAWAEDCHQISEFVTAKAKIRGGLKPSQREIARRILKEFGFTDKEMV